MSKLSYKNLRLFLYLGVIQLFTALGAAVVGFLYFRYGHERIFDFVSGFFPDIAYMSWSIIGIMMLLVQMLGNLVGAAYSFLRKQLSANIAILTGGIEALWMGFQFFVLHQHHVLIVCFFLLSFAIFVCGYLLSERIKEFKKIDRD